jgi:hypothetical protein
MSGLVLPFTCTSGPFPFPVLSDSLRLASATFLSFHPPSYSHLLFQQNKPLPPAVHSFQSLFHLPTLSSVCSFFISVRSVSCSVSRSSLFLTVLITSFFIQGILILVQLPQFDRLTIDTVDSRLPSSHHNSAALLDQVIEYRCHLHQTSRRNSQCCISTNNDDKHDSITYRLRNSVRIRAR